MATVPVERPQKLHPQRREYEEATAGLRFTKDFNESLDAIMRDPMATIGQRVMAWMKRASWGNYCLYCVKDDGSPAFQVDCAADLGIDKRRVSDAMRYFSERGYLRMDGPAKTLYPSLSPVLGSPSEANCKKSGVYRTFLELWKVQCAPDFSELQVHLAAVKQILKVRDARFREFLDDRTKSDASLMRDSETTEEIESVSQSVNDLEPEPGQDRPTDLDEIAEIIAPIAQQLGETVRPSLLQGIYERLRGAPPGKLIGVINRKRDKIHSLGIVLNFAEEIGRSWDAGGGTRAAAADRAHQQQTYRDEDMVREAQKALASPDASEAERELAREVITRANGRAHVAAQTR